MKKQIVSKTKVISHRKEKTYLKLRDKLKAAGNFKRDFSNGSVTDISSFKLVWWISLTQYKVSKVNHFYSMFKNVDFLF